MIYFVTNQQSLFSMQGVSQIKAEEAVSMMEDWNIIQFDTETDSTDARLGKLLTMQFGSKSHGCQIVVDCTSTSPMLFKHILEDRRLVGHNLKFDLQWLYNYGIIPRRVYDTMIVEQLLYLGFPHEVKHYSLQAVAWERLQIHIDKSVRGEIIWRGIDEATVKYAAGDVVHLEDIMQLQMKEAKEKGCVIGAKLECDAVPAIAYMEWCGIKLDEYKWKAKMEKDRKNLGQAREELDKYFMTIAHTRPELGKYVVVDTQGDLWKGFDLTPKVIVNWDSPAQVTTVFRLIGFNTSVQDKKTGKDKDSVLEKHLRSQKGIDDGFLKVYFDYKEFSKVCSTYGQGHLNMINPRTGRIHTTFKQLGALSGRMSCGSMQPNAKLAEIKKIPKKDCTYANLQQLPHDEDTRGAFVAPKGHLMVSADFSAEEARLGGDIYQDEAILDIFRNGLDSHSVYAKAFFSELKDVDVKDIKSKYPHLRQLAKGPEFALSFGGGFPAIMSALSCTREKAEEIIRNYENTFKGTAEYARRGERKLMEKGYVDICPKTGHKLWWWDFDKWKERQKSYDQKFWEEYRNVHKPARDHVYIEVRKHFQAKSKWSRMVRNACTQGTGAIIMKESLTNLFNWIVDNRLFSKVNICVAVHDEIVCDYPEEITDFPDIIKGIMETAAAKYCKSIPIPAEPAVGDHWIH